MELLLGDMKATSPFCGDKRKFYVTHNGGKSDRKRRENDWICKVNCDWDKHNQHTWSRTKDFPTAEISPTSCCGVNITEVLPKAAYFSIVTLLLNRFSPLSRINKSLHQKATWENKKTKKKKKINTNKKETDEWISRRWQFSWAFPRFASVWRFGDENETTADVQVLWDDFHVWILSHFFVIFSRQKNPSAWKKTPAIFFRLIHTDDVHRSCTVGIILHQLCTES